MSGTRGGLARIVAMGVALALALLLLMAKEATAGKYSVAQCGWHLERRRELGRHDRRGEVPPRRLLRDAAHLRPVRRRPPEELHQGRPADGLGHALRPLALGRAGRDGHHSRQWHLVAHAARRDRAADRRRQLERRLRRLRRRGHHRRHPARLRRRLLPGPAGARGSPALRQGGKQIVQPRTGLVVGDPGADDHDRGRLSAGLFGQRRHPRRRLAARRTQARLPRHRRRRRPEPDRSADRRHPGGAPRTSLQRGADQRRAAGDDDAALPDRPGRLLPDRDDHVQRRAAQRRPLRHRLRRQRQLPAGSDDPDRQQPAGPSAQPRRRRRRRLAAHQRLRLGLGRPRPGGGQPDRRRLLAHHRARWLRQRRQIRPLVTSWERSRTSSCPMPGSTRSASGCATKPATKRRPRRSRCRCASTTSRPRSPSKRPAAMPCPSGSAPRSATPTPARRVGKSSTGGWTARNGPNCRRNSKPATQAARLSSPPTCRAISAPAPTCFAPKRSTGPATRPRAAAASTAPR